MPKDYGLCAGLVLTVAFLAAPLAAQQPDPPRPFFHLRSRESVYAGPGREEPEPDVEAVGIAWFGPSDPNDPEAGDLWCAAQLAIDEANAAGGYRGRPFQLRPAWSADRWGSGVAQLARMAYSEQVWGIVGGIDGAGTHLAEQVVAKARLALVSPVGTDKTVNLANVPWMFSCLPSDDILARTVADGVAARGRDPGLAVVSADDHDTRLFVAELDKEFAARQLVPDRHIHYDPAAGHVEEVAEEVVSLRPRTLVVAGTAAASADVVMAVRRRGYTGAIFGGPWMGRRAFIAQAGAAADGVLFPLLYQAGDEVLAFEQAFRGRYDRAPDYASASTYDAVRLLLAAIRGEGLNRARIGDGLRRLSPWQGVCGVIAWDNVGSNPRAVPLGTLRDGRVERP